MTIASNLRRIREAKKLTQKEVWEAAEISKSSLTTYEAGRSDPTGDTIESATVAQKSTIRDGGPWPLRDQGRIAAKAA